jgi:hypothetical protein
MLRRPRTAQCNTARRHASQRRQGRQPAGSFRSERLSSHPAEEDPDRARAGRDAVLADAVMTVSGDAAAQGGSSQLRAGPA